MRVWRKLPPSRVKGRAKADRLQVLQSGKIEKKKLSSEVPKIALDVRLATYIAFV